MLLFVLVLYLGVKYNVLPVLHQRPDSSMVTQFFVRVFTCEPISTGAAAWCGGPTPRSREADNHGRGPAGYHFHWSVAQRAWLSALQVCMLGVWGSRQPRPNVRQGSSLYESHNL